MYTNRYAQRLYITNFKRYNFDLFMPCRNRIRFSHLWNPLRVLIWKFLIYCDLLLLLELLLKPTGEIRFRCFFTSSQIFEVKANLLERLRWIASTSKGKCMENEQKSPRWTLNPDCFEINARKNLQQFFLVLKEVILWFFHSLNWNLVWLILKSFPIGYIITLKLYECDLNSNCRSSIHEIIENEWKKSQ